MQNLLFTVLGNLAFLLLLYFGYRDDYKRNPKEFKDNVLLVIVILLVIVGANAIIYNFGITFFSDT